MNTNLFGSRNLFVLYTLAAGINIFNFAGHGGWALSGKVAFADLITDSLESTFNIFMATETALGWVKFIGVVDLTIAVIMTLALIGVWRGTGFLAKFARSRVMVALFTWGIFWGLATGFSRVSAHGYDAIYLLDLIERGGNYFGAAIGLYLTLMLRKMRPPSSLSPTSASR
ncbi:hypothetical protein HYW58_01760 [Candidatus Kaiserbacteria bacterium]|nr:hypothetical protein [Candidatus Kaiserbacteria bacterium]